jgi:hypothetical protein
LIDGIPTRAKAMTLARALGTGPRFAEKASEELPSGQDVRRVTGQALVYRAVFAAQVGKLVGLLALQGAFALFVIRRIEPSRDVAAPRGARHETSGFRSDRVRAPGEGAT